jgi:hypothetical protein
MSGTCAWLSQDRIATVMRHAGGNWSIGVGGSGTLITLPLAEADVRALATLLAERVTELDAPPARRLEVVR